MKIGLVLSGGGSRGFAEIGVLKILKSHGIRIDRIAGSSVGSLIGACYAYNPEPQAIETLLLKIKSKRNVYDYAFSTKGFIKGRRLEEYISEYFNQDKIPAQKDREFMFEDLKIPLAINATDIVNQREIVLNSGPLLPAVMASMSYPGFFTTRKINEQICVDGGVVNPLPFDILGDVDYIILVDVSHENIKITEDSNVKDIILQSTLTMQKTIVDKNLERLERHIKTPYSLIVPRVEQHNVLDFDKVEWLVKEGEAAALAQIEKIKSDIEMLKRKERLRVVEA